MIMCVMEQRKQVMMVPYQAFMQGVPKESITLELELTYQEEALKFVKDIVKEMVKTADLEMHVIMGALEVLKCPNAMLRHGSQE